MPVYFIRQGHTGSVKIGLATDVAKRFKQLQTGQPVVLRILRVLDGSKADEAALHKRFNNLRLVGEWFHFDETMLSSDFGLPDLVIPSVGRTVRGREHCLHIPTFGTAIMTNRYFSGLLALVEQVREVKGMRDSAISRAVFGPGDAKFIGKLRTGKNFSINSGGRLEQWLLAQLASAATRAA